jgi:hypothetical protein
MKRVKLVWLFSTVLTLALTAAVSWAEEPDPMDPGEIGAPVETIEPGVGVAGSSEQFANALNGAYSGTAMLTVDGVTIPVSIISQPLDLAELPDNFGAYAGTTTTLLDFGDGNTLTTEDELLLTPTEEGWYSAHSTMTITGGTGLFANARGVIDGYGAIQLDAGIARAMWLLEGRILS